LPLTQAMKSAIDDRLTEQERTTLRLYRNPTASGLGRQVRLSVQYAVGAGIFLGLAIWLNEPLYAIVVYGVFILWMLVRLRGARTIAAVTPRIIEKYESEIKALKSSGEGAVTNRTHSIPESRTSASSRDE